MTHIKQFKGLMEPRLAKLAGISVMSIKAITWSMHVI